MPIASLSVLLLLLGAFTAAEVHAAGGAEPAGPLAGEPADTRCSMKPKPGPCKALFERYYYEEKSKGCRPFLWGGCDGAVPFETMAECEQACLSPQTLRMQELKPLRGDVYLVLVNVEEATLTFNGAAVQPESFGEQAKLLRFAPSWVSGRNVLTVQGTGPDGTAVSGRYTFVYAGDGTLVEGETVTLDYGTQGSKSGPVFRVAVEGPAVVPARATEPESYVMPEELKTEIVLRVIPKP